MSKLNSKSATPLGVSKQTQQQQHFNQQNRAPIGAINSAILINFTQLIRNGQEEQYSFESELYQGFAN